MSSESMVHEAEGQIGYLLRDHGAERNNYFNKIQLVGFYLSEIVSKPQHNIKMRKQDPLQNASKVIHALFSHLIFHISIFQPQFHIIMHM